jgi:hypothetical protein
MLLPYPAGRRLTDDVETGRSAPTRGDLDLEQVSAVEGALVTHLTYRPRS